MEYKENYFCSLCQKQFQLNIGDYLFTYNAKCINNHKFENIEIDDLLGKKGKNISIYQCKEHQKKIMAHCFLCNEDICISCINTSHKSHKIDYLKKLNMNSYEQFCVQNLLTKENKIINIFLSELEIFQNKLNIYIDGMKSQITKEMKLRQEILNNILKKEFTYIDIQNAKTILNDKSFQKINNNINNFCKSKTFIEKYDNMKNIFNEAIQARKYLENTNLLSIIKKFGINIIPINSNHFIRIDNNFDQNSAKLEIIKDNSDKYFKELKYNILSEKSFNYTFDKVVLKNNKNYEKEFVFYVILFNNSYIMKTNLFEVKILNILDNNKIKYEIKQIFIDRNKLVSGLIFMENNKIIIFERFGEIYLYNNSFNKIKLLDDQSETITSYFKINENIFVYSNQLNDTIYVGLLDNNELNKYPIQKCGNIFINYFEKKKILVSHDNENLYLISFNCLFPEVIQKIQIDNFNDNTDNYNDNGFLKNLEYINNFFKEDSIYIRKKQKSFENGLFYLVEYIVQYKIDNGELKEVSRIEEKRKELKETNI